MGSIESSIHEKKLCARKSLAFNLKNTTFAELFPEMCEEINERLVKIEENSKIQNSQKAATDLNKDKNENETPNTEQSNLHSICSNLIVLLCFAIFALIVNYVIKTIN